MEGRPDNMIGERLKNARLALDLTQEALAAEVGVTAPAISQYENEERLPSLDVFLRMVDILHIAPEWALGRDTGVVSDNTEYVVRVAAEELAFIKEIQKYQSLHKAICSERMPDIVASWSKKV